MYTDFNLSKIISHYSAMLQITFNIVQVNTFAWKILHKTVFQDNMDTHKINIEKLQDFLVKLCNLCRANVIFIKEELTKLRADVDEQRKWINDKCIELLQVWEKNNEETAIRFREQTQRLTVDHELELSDMKAALKDKDDVIELYKKEKEDVKSDHQRVVDRLETQHQGTKELLEKTKDEIKVFEKRQEDLEILKQKEIKELQEKMHMEYKAEIESLRSRYAPIFIYVSRLRRYIVMLFMYFRYLFQTRHFYPKD